VVPLPLQTRLWHYSYGEIRGAKKSLSMLIGSKFKFAEYNASHSMCGPHLRVWLNVWPSIAFRLDTAVLEAHTLLG